MSGTPTVAAVGVTGDGVGTDAGRLTWLWAIGGLCAAYLGALVLTWPRAFVISDEAAYVGQADALAHGHLRWETVNPFSALPAQLPLSDYPPGTSLLQVPSVALGGWRAAALASALCLVGTVALLVVWLRRAGRSPWFAALLLANPVALVMGRVAMSDVPSMAVVTASLVAFWHGDRPGDARRWAWPVAGFLGGLSVAFRDPNPLLPFVFLAGAAVRRDRHAWTGLAALVAGGAVRLGLSAWILDDAFYVKPPGGRPDGVGEQIQALGLLAAALTVLVPAGLVAVAAYSGRRRPELVLGVVVTVALFSVYGYTGAASGGLARLVLAPRFVLPVTPLVIFALAEVAPRWFRRWVPRDRQPALARGAATAVVVTSVVALIVTTAALSQRTDRDSAINEAIQNAIPDDGRLVVNAGAMVPHVGPTVGPQPWLDRAVLPPIRLPEMVARPGPVYLVFLDRSGSGYRDQEAAANDAYIGEAGVWTKLQPVADRHLPGGDRLRIFRPQLR